MAYSEENRPPKTLNEIADELGVSRQTIGNIESRALRKLRDSALAKFAVYVEAPVETNDGMFNSVEYARRNRW